LPAVVEPQVPDGSLAPPRVRALAVVLVPLAKPALALPLIASVAAIVPAAENVLVPEDQKEFEEAEEVEGVPEILSDDPEGKQPRKYYVNDGRCIRMVVDYEQVLGVEGSKLTVVKYSDYTAEQVREISPNAATFYAKWLHMDERQRIIDVLEERGINFEELARNTGLVDADPFDLLCHIAFNAPLRSRRERAQRLRTGKVDFFDYFKPEARLILNEILDKYVDYGIAQFKMPDILKVDPIAQHGNVMEIASLFGGPEQLREALSNLQGLLYAEQ
jgi:type I restriction enzyme R subunit